MIQLDNNKITPKLFNISIILLTFITFTVYLTYKYRFAFLANDDITQFFPKVVISHLCAIPIFLTAFFIKFLPGILNINIQDFAFFSQGIFKSIFFNLIILTISLYFFKFNKNFMLFPFIYIISFFGVFLFQFQFNFQVMYEAFIYFAEYYLPFLFFLLFLNKLFIFYIEKEKQLDTKNKLLILIYLLLSVLSNETIFFITALLFTAVLIEKFIKNITDSKRNIMRFDIILFITIFLVGIFYISPINNIIHSTYDFGLNLPSFYEIKAFLSLFFNVIFLKNIYFWIPAIICLVILIFKKNKETLDISIIKFTLYTILSTLAFYFFTLFIVQSCPYSYFNGYILTKYKFWLLYPCLLLQMRFILITAALFVAGYLSHNEYPKINKLILFIWFKTYKIVKKYLLVIILLISSFLYINNYYNFNQNQFHTKKNQQIFYISDKISYFYLSQNKTALVPYNKDITMIIGLNDFENKYMNTKKPLTTEQILYLDYLHENYNLNTKSGIIFLPPEEAIKKYIDNGGTLNKKELKEADFSEIPKKNKKLILKKKFKKD